MLYTHTDTSESDQSLSFNRTSHDLIASIHACFIHDRPSQEIMQDIALILRQFGPRGVHAYIKKLLNNDDLLAQIASQSYLHNNGFYKLLLAENETFCIRLHIWMPGSVAYETLHSHCWHMASTVIHGSLQSEVWESSVSPSAQFYDEYLYENKESEPRYLGKTRVAPVKISNRTAGEAYTLQPHVLHRILYDGQAMVATLMCRSSRTLSWSRNIIVNDHIPDPRPQYLHTQALRAFLEDFNRRYHHD